jgi:hypothetical protein
MPSTSSLITKLAHDFPAYTFIPANEFLWSPRKQTIFYASASNDTASLLHELAHAILGHASYDKDVELLDMERDAWHHATSSLASRYTVSISPDQVEDSLDTYRDWLHARSTCPSCNATGIQTKRGNYRCIACRMEWRVNDARICALRRYKLSK